MRNYFDMKTLLKITDKDVYQDPAVFDITNYRHRKAARGVVFNAKGEIYLLKNSANRYHKLPGGGVEDGENIEAAFARELHEEIGTQATIIAELGITIEYRARESEMQTSYCFVAIQSGAETPPEFDPQEQIEGFTRIKVRDIYAAISLLEQEKITTYNSAFILRRDLALLKAAKPIINNTLARN